MEKNPLRGVLSEVGISILAGVIAAAILILYVEPSLTPNQPETPIQLVVEVASAIFAFLAVTGIAFITATARNGNILRAVYEVQKLAKVDRDAIIQLISNRFKALSHDIGEIHSEQGGSLSNDEANTYYLALFSRGKIYEGTDFHVPSFYLEVLDRYLAAHERFQARRANKLQGTRILMTEKDALVTDFSRNEKKFRNFVERHKGMNVILKWIDLNDARSIAEKMSLKPEIGIWHGEYSIQFETSDLENKREVKLFLSANKTKVYEKTVRYFNELAKKAHPITEIITEFEKDPKPQPTHYEKKLADNWDEFIRWDDRKKTEEDFLKNVLRLGLAKREIAILDAAAGTGVETVYLAEHGYSVHANEIDESFRKVLQKNIDTRLNKTQADKIRISNYDWLELSQYYNPKTFHVVFVLGNSLTLICEEDLRKRCVAEFFSVLRPGGCLVIDERNFEKILLCPKDIGPEKFYKIKYSAKYVYCGKYPGSVVGWPVEISDELVRFAYGRNEKSIMGHMDMHPFRDGELAGLLESIGFIDIRKYADYKVCNDDRNADFFVYVAWKPGE